MVAQQQVPLIEFQTRGENFQNLQKSSHPHSRQESVSTCTVYMYNCIRTCNIYMCMYVKLIKISIYNKPVVIFQINMQNDYQCIQPTGTIKNLLNYEY